MSNDQKIIPWLCRPVRSSIPWLTNELLIFFLLIFLVFTSRFYSLGDRVISHDESLHTYFSWLLTQGNGYEHNPMMHGPLQFHLLGLVYFLFGATDFTARLPHAIASIMTIILLWKWRKYLGRAGMLVSAAMGLVSPFLIFYGRYARNEAFIGVVGLLMLYAILRYLETGTKKYLFLLTLASVLHFTIKETAFIYTAQALLYLLFVFIGSLLQAKWQNQTQYRAFIILLISGLILVVTGLGLFYIGKSAETQSTTLDLTAPSLSTETALLILAGSCFLTGGIIAIRGLGWKTIKSERSFDMLIMLGTFVLPQLVAFPIKFVGSLVNPPNGWNPLDYSFQTSLPLGDAIRNHEFGLYMNEFFSQGIVHTGVILLPILIISIAIGMWWNRRLWLLNAAIWYIIFTLFYTTFFTNGQGFFTGMVGSLGYWLEQQGVNRGSQPWYYYLLIQIPVYEYLPVVGSVLALFYGIRRRSPAQLPRVDTSDQPKTEDNQRPINSDNFLSLLSWWSLSSIVAYTIAGEKMPWLTFHITLPMILLSGWAVGKIFDSMNLAQFTSSRGWIMSGSLIILTISLFACVSRLMGSDLPFQGNQIEQLASTASFIFSFLSFTGGLAGVIFIFTRYRWQYKDLSRLGIIVTLSILFVFTGRTAIRATYINYDDATEYLVYAHGARGIKDIMEQVDEISRRTAGETNLVIAYDVSAPDTGVSWPFTWYLRNYPNTRPFDQPTKSLQEASVIIVDQKNFDKILPVVGDAYYRFDYIRMVWPNQDYFGLTWDRILSTLTNPDLRHGIFDIWFNRDYTRYASARASVENNAYFNQSAYEISSWEPSDKMRLYIRKDVAAQIWEFGVGPSDPITIVDPYEANMTPLTVDFVIDTSGTAPGQLNNPHGIAIAKDDSIYIADTFNNRVVHLSSSGEFIHQWGVYSDAANGPVSLDALNQPWGIAVSPSGEWVYVTDTWNHRIVKYTNDGVPIKAWGIGKYGGDDPLGLWGPRGIIINQAGDIFVTDTGNKRIVAYDEDGNFLGQVGEEGLGPGQFSEPVGISIDAQGNLYVADTWNQRIQVLAPIYQADGTIVFVTLSQWDISGWYGQSLENKPYIAIDPNDFVFVTDPEAGHVLQFTTSGEFLKGWRSDPSSSNQIGLPSGIALDQTGNIYVVDTLNAHIIRFSQD